MTLWTEVGDVLGSGFAGFCLWLLFGALALVHPVLMVTYAAFAESRWRLLFELHYGLLNPLAYLLVFQPGLFWFASPPWLTTTSWCLLLGYWGLRALATARHARLVTAWLCACCVLVVGVAVRDLIVWLPAASSPDGLLVIFFLAPLYLSALMIAAKQFPSSTSAFFLSRSASHRRVVLWSMAFAALSLSSSASTPPKPRRARGCSSTAPRSSTPPPKRTSTRA